MKTARWISIILSCAFIAMLAGGCIIVPHPRTVHATGTISGRVVDARGRPVALAEVKGVYMRGWTQVVPPVPNAFVVVETKSDKHGNFSFTTGKRIDEIHANTLELLNTRSGRLVGARQTGNVVVVK